MVLGWDEATRQRVQLDKIQGPGLRLLMRSRWEEEESPIKESNREQPEKWEENP